MKFPTKEECLKILKDNNVPGNIIDHSKAVFVPRGVANSFQTLEENTYYSYLVNAHWSPEKTAEYKFVNLADPDLAIKWPISLDKAIISDKDKSHPMLKDIKPFEV